MAHKEFRKPPRYMVGDIVYSHGFICIICSVYPFNIDYSYDLKVIDGQSLGKICQNDIMHVHIWEDFLKKNGWEHKDDIYIKEFPHRKLVVMDKNVYVINESCSMFLCPAEFVPQIQHLLFGLGLNSEMEV